MNKLQLICLLFTFVTTFESCSTNDLKNKSVIIDSKHITQVKFEKKQHQFGDVKEGEVVGCYFFFKNEGDFPCIISNVDAGCGCTEVNYPHKPVMPGEKGEVEIKYNSTGFHGLQYKVVKLELNTKEKRTELVFSANVIN